MANLFEHYKNICSSETIHSHKKGFYREFCEVSKQSIGLDYLENIFRNIQLDEERLLNIFFDKHISIKLFSMLNKISKIYKKKDALQSKKIRIECLNLEDAHKITNYLTEINKAVIYAPEIDVSNFCENTTSSEIRQNTQVVNATVESKTYHDLRSSSIHVDEATKLPHYHGTNSLLNTSSVQKQRSYEGNVSPATFDSPQQPVYVPSVQENTLQGNAQNLRQTAQTAHCFNSNANQVPCHYQEPTQPDYYQNLHVQQQPRVNSYNSIPRVHSQQLPPPGQQQPYYTQNISPGSFNSPTSPAQSPNVQRPAWQGEALNLQLNGTAQLARCQNSPGNQPQVYNENLTPLVHNPTLPVEPSQSYSQHSRASVNTPRLPLPGQEQHCRAQTVPFETFNSTTLPAPSPTGQRAALPGNALNLSFETAHHQNPVNQQLQSYNQNQTVIPQSSLPDREQHLYLQNVQAAALQGNISNGACKFIDNGYTLPITLITRADILQKMKKYQLAYEDLKILLNLDVPFLKRIKLLQRISLCRTLKTQKSLCNFEVTSHCQVRESSGEIRSTTMSNFVKIRKSILAGKEAVANAAVNPGEVLVAENPLASCLLPDAYNSHCQTCFKRIKISYGCSDCSSISFCSYKCRNIGLSTYHKYECKISCMIIGSGMSILSHLALRIVTQLGLKNCLSLYYYNIGDIICTKLRNYLKLYDLEMHSLERSKNDFLDRVLMAAFLIQCLKQVDFFCDSNYNHDFHNNNQHNEIVVGTLLLRHLQLLQFNAYEIYDNVSENNPNVSETYNQRYIGVGIYPTAARFNHECYSATFRYFIGKMIILRSSRLLQINNVIAENYGPIFTKKDRSHRQRHLYGRYWFNCKCQACVHDWPLLNDIEYSVVQIRCIRKSCTEYIKVYLNKNYKKNYACLKCLKIQSFRELHQNLIKKCLLWYAYGITAINRQYTPEAAQILIKALKVFHHVANVPHRFTHLAELGQQYCLINNA